MLGAGIGNDDPQHLLQDPVEDDLARDRLRGVHHRGEIVQLGPQRGGRGTDGGLHRRQRDYAIAWLQQAGILGEELGRLGQRAPLQIASARLM